eukprot:NODE_462_length_8172_cov_0.295181.p3 type:complete len:244 gc:universal NODE_462_length_8172_cov_0.295181:3231-3962(+)
MCLRIGWHSAIELAKKSNKPLMGIHHMEAHCLSPLIDNAFNYPYLCLIASGGHTQLVKVNSALNFELLGNCLDDAIGEAYDKTSRLFNMSTSEMCKLVHGKTNKTKVNIMPGALNSNFSFSGLKSAIKRMKSDGKYDDLSIMVAFNQSAMSHVKRQILKILHKHEFTAVTGAGGAILNPSIQELLITIGREHSVPVYIPKSEYLVDNAAMIGFCGHLQLKEKRPFDILDKKYYDKWSYNRVQN